MPERGADGGAFSHSPSGQAGQPGPHARAGRVGWAEAMPGVRCQEEGPMTDDDADRIRSILRGERERDIEQGRREYDDGSSRLCVDCGSPLGLPFHRECSGETVVGYRWNGRLARAMPWDERAGRPLLIGRPASDYA